MSIGKGRRRKTNKRPAFKTHNKGQKPKKPRCIKIGRK